MSKYLLGLFLLSNAAFGSFEVYLKTPNSIPLYAQETNVWCGAASAQMMLEGFPAGEEHTYKQKFVWDTIQPLKVETGWYTDPDGLKRVMDALGGESNWTTRCAKTSAALIKSAVRNLSDRKFPTAALVYGSAHWIVLIGATTDANPGTADAIKLEQVEAHDPWKAQHVLVSGTTWFQKYWHSPARERGKWDGCYVTIEENTNTRSEPTFDLRVDAPVTSGTPISARKSLRLARQHLMNLAAANPAFAALGRQALFDARLVTHEGTHYYLISVGDARSRLASGALMLNAYSGAWEGLSQFGAPVRYADVRSGGEWLFVPSQESPSPFFPVYRTSGARGPRYVDHEGRVSTGLHAMTPGS